MISINGLNKFREFFEEYDNNYVLIGGTACAIIFNGYRSYSRKYK